MTILKACSSETSYIICSAIWFQDDNVYVHQPNNIKSGIVVCGMRHHNCFLTAKYIKGNTKNSPITRPNNR